MLITKQATKDTVFLKKKLINCRGKFLNLDNPIVMGILNLTPDSFFDGGKNASEEQVFNKVQQMLSEGASIIDVGGYSTRPNSKEVSKEEELKRVIPIINFLNKEFPDIVISIDTFRATVAEKAIESGAAIINDVSGGTTDTKMFDCVASLNVPYMLTHIKGSPKTTQHHPEYKNLMKDVLYYFSEKLETLYKLGVNDIVLDPGFGFGKSIDNNYQLLGNLAELKLFELPVLVGLSRKGMTHKPLNINANESLNASTVLHTISLLNGANILRVHDVKEAMEAVKLVAKLEMNTSKK